MAQKLNESTTPPRAEVKLDGEPRNALMKECLRKAEEIRRSLAGRKHTDSTLLIAEDRKR